jgi:hypothetical protein
LSFFFPASAPGAKHTRAILQIKIIDSRIGSSSPLRAFTYLAAALASTVLELTAAVDLPAKSRRRKIFRGGLLLN